VSTNSYRLITPPEEEEIYPYRRVWRSIALEGSILLAVAGIVFALTSLLNIGVPRTVAQPVNALLALLPFGSWLVFSLGREQSALQPRKRLLAVAIVSALVANGVSIPFIDGIFQPERWLPTGSAINRIVGYTFTVGIVQEVLKYLVVRYLVWPDHFRTRLDGVAYGAASAVGYATMVNIQFVLSGAALPDIVAISVFGTWAVNLAGSIVVSYGLAEVRFDNPSPFLLTTTVALAALVTGITIPVREGLTNAGFSLQGGTSSPILGLGLSAGLLLVTALLIAFLYNSTERREREAAASREV
jgi:RsiW-degrading membrane proteinase PrsW (M82 family)